MKILNLFVPKIPPGDKILFQYLITTVNIYYKKKINIKDRIITTASLNGVINFYSTDLKWLSSIDDNDITGFPILCLSFNKDSSLLAYSSQCGILKIWKLKASDYLLNTQFKNNPVTAMSFDNEGNHLAMGFLNGDSLLLNLDIMGYTKFKQKGPAKINGIKFSPFNNSQICLAYDDGSLRIFETTTNSKLCEFIQHEGKCCNVAFSPINKLFLTSAGFDGKINFYDIQSNK